MSDRDAAIIAIEADDASVTPCTLSELAQRGVLKEDFIVTCIDHGIALVPGRHANEWRFTTTTIIRLHKAWRLHRDLGLHVDNLALVLDLLDEREALAREISALRHRLRHWEE